jgi:hypothetical protein
MYINSFCSISSAGILNPQFDLNSLQILSSTQSACIEPDYKELISPMQLRRMSKPVRSGVAAAKLCMQSLNNFMPQSIHVGTAYGMLEDSENFLKKLIEQDEQMLNPTAFIQSTHNTVSGQIALSIGCTAHNMTYVHNAHSFESALLDASLFMENLQDDENILIGAVEEFTQTSYAVLNRFDVYNEANIAGEGASFFAISKNKQAQSLAQVKAFEMFTLNDESELESIIHEFIEAQDLLFSNETMLLHSFENDLLFSSIPNNASYLSYSGKYATMAAFGVAYGSIKLKDPVLKNILILTGFGTHYSLILLSQP